MFHYYEHSEEGFLARDDDYDDELREPEGYNCLTPTLHDVNRSVVSIASEAKKAAVSLMLTMVEKVVAALKGDELFAKVYNGFRPVGSFFDGLRVTAPTEFDVNLVLKFPFHKTCSVEAGVVPGFVQVCAGPKNESFLASLFRGSMDWTLKRIVDDEGYILRDKVLQWWHRMFSLHFEKVIRASPGYKIKWRTSGPAFTLNVSSPSNKVYIDIDLVPVLQFGQGDATTPTPVFSQWLRKHGNPSVWYIVPKPLRDRSFSFDASDRLWRLSFTDQEKVIMKSKQHLKPTNKLLKRMRDNFAWKPLTSYYIKTVFLHEADKRNTEFYRNNLGYLFVHSLSVLRKRLSSEYLPFFWDHRMNLFERVPTGNMAFRLRRILNKIHRLVDERDFIGLDAYVKSLLIGGHAVCVENRAPHAITPSRLPNYYKIWPFGVFEKGCSRCEKVKSTIPTQSGCVLL